MASKSCPDCKGTGYVLQHLFDGETAKEICLTCEWTRDMEIAVAYYKNLGGNKNEHLQRMR